MEEDVHVCEMVCTLNIDAELLKRPLGYKYVVFSPKMTKHDDCYEKLHPFTLYSTDDPDRCLWIPPQIHHRVYGGNGSIFINPQHACVVEIKVVCWPNSCMCVCLFVCLPACLSACLPVCLSVTMKTACSFICSFKS